MVYAQPQISSHDARAERHRRLNEEFLRYYKPHAKQLALHQSQAPTRGYVGANKTGKSWAGTADILWTIGKVHPYGYSNPRRRLRHH